MSKIRYAVIGSGWRAEFYIRIAKEVSDKFELTSVLIRDYEKGRKFSEGHNVKVVQTIEEIQEDNPDFVVLAIKRGIISGYLPKLFEKEIPVLCETPPGEDLEALNSVWNEYKKYNAKIQIAEQYFAQPLYAAWQKAIDDGKLGEVENINISALHGYHEAVKRAGAGGHKEINRSNLTKEQIEKSLDCDVVKLQLDMLKFRNTFEAFNFDADIQVDESENGIIFRWIYNDKTAILNANLKEMSFTAQGIDENGKQAYNLCV